MTRRARTGSRSASDRVLIDTLERRMLLAAPSGEIASLALINSDTGAFIQALPANGSIDLARVGHHVSVQAQTTGSDIRSVRFSLDGQPKFRVDSQAPFTASDSAGRRRAALTLTPGTHTLIVTPYADLAGADTPGSSYIATVYVADSGMQAAPFRVNAGGSAYTDSQGRVYRSDQGFSGGWAYSSPFAVEGTADDALYAHYRAGSLIKYARRVANGTYDLRLHFVEPRQNPTTPRIFDVFAEGKVVLSRLNIARLAGPQTALVQTVKVTVTDGNLDVMLRGMFGTAVISALEILPTRTPVSPEPLRINAGGAESVDSIGRLFLADTGFTGGQPGAIAVDLPDTPDDAIYGTYREGDFSFAHPAANGNYIMLLGFADPTSTAAGQRVFDVSAEGTLALDNLDIVGTAGASKTLVKAIPVTINDERLDLAFTGVTGNPIVSYVELIPTDPSQNAVHPYANAISTASQLRELGQTLVMNAMDRRGTLPADFTELARAFPSQHELFANLRAGYNLPRGEMSDAEIAAWVATRDDFVYRGGGLKYALQPALSVLAYENPAIVYGDELNVLFFDGHVETVSRATLASIVGTPLPPGPAGPIPRPLGLNDPRITPSMTNLNQIGSLMLTYANDHRGFYPPTLGESIYGGRDVDASIFANPRNGTAAPPPAMTDEQKIAWINGNNDYLYGFAGQRYPSARDVIVYENPAEMAWGIDVLRGDGRVVFLEMRWAIEALRRSGAV